MDITWPHIKEPQNKYYKERKMLISIDKLCIHYLVENLIEICKMNNRECCCQLSFPPLFILQLVGSGNRGS